MFHVKKTTKRTNQVRNFLLLTNVVEKCHEVLQTDQKWNDAPHLVIYDLSGWQMEASGDFCQWKGSDGAAYIYQLISYTESIYDYISCS